MFLFVMCLTWHVGIIAPLMLSVRHGYGSEDSIDKGNTLMFVEYCLVLKVALPIRSCYQCGTDRPNRRDVARN